jgi:hypothetical protein
VDAVSRPATLGRPPVRDAAQYEPHLFEERCWKDGVQVGFPGDEEDPMYGDHAERVNSFSSTWEARDAAHAARRLTASIIEKLGG